MNCRLSDLLRHSPEETRAVLGDLFAVKPQRAQVLIHAALERPIAGLLRLRVRWCPPDFHDDPPIWSRYMKLYVMHGFPYHYWGPVSSCLNAERLDSLLISVQRKVKSVSRSRAALQAHAGTYARTRMQRSKLYCGHSRSREGHLGLF